MACTKMVTLSRWHFLTKLRESDSITVELDLDEPEVTLPERETTYAKIKEHILNKYDFKVSSLNIAQVKQEG